MDRQISFALANKQRLDSILPRLFHILHTNMSEIAPTGDTYEEDFAVWSRYLVPAMKKEQRQLVLMFLEDELAGYFQYDITGPTLMMEEIQIKPEYQGTGLFRELYRWLEKELSSGLVFVEAYAHKSNRKSQGILEHLGLEKIGENKSGSSFHYRGTCRELWARSKS